MYLRARDYSPGTGRFTSRDTVRPNGPATQGYNAYHYTANNPTTRIDPTGHTPEFLAELAGAALVYAEYKSLTQTIRDKSNLINSLPPMARGLVSAVLGFVVGILPTLLYTLLFKAMIDAVPWLADSMYGRSLSFGSMSKLFQPATNIIDACAGTKSICKLVQKLLPKLPCIVRNIAETGFVDKVGGVDANAFDYTVAAGLGAVSCINAVHSVNRSAIQSAATRAAERAGEGRGAAYGTRVHTLFREEIQALPDYETGVWTEVSFLNGREVRHGTLGSKRVDVLVGTSKTEPKVIYDLKTGSAMLDDLRIEEIRQHLPPDYRNVPIVEIRP